MLRERFGLAGCLTCSQYDA
uniref:Uncharacterized protein n=1 Tax=Anguilla anguilla TaxID=7936 RepID=A0A0E9UDI2_ANGAN